jgi:hypothetical protein
VLPESLRREGRSHGGGHGESLLSHLRGRLGRATTTLCHQGFAGHNRLDH